MSDESTTPLYSLSQAHSELKSVYPKLPFERFDDAEDGDFLRYNLLGQFVIVVETEGDDQFSASVCVEENGEEAVDSADFIYLSTFVCRSAPAAVNQVLRKFFRYHGALLKQMNYVDEHTHSRKALIERPPLVNDVQRVAINRIREEDGEKFLGTTHEEAEEFITGIKR